MKIYSSLILCIIALLIISCKNEQPSNDKFLDHPIMMMRLRGNHTTDDKHWNDVFQNIAKYPKCCDNIWFSTGLGYPSLEYHKEHAKLFSRAKRQLAEIGIGTSIQIQMTIGHGDTYGDDYTAMTWGGWTGSTGVVDKHCSCPRQKKFIEYFKEVARIYASIEPITIWIDDDLRFDNHQPATNNSIIGCWCDTCIAEFNKENSSNWTRETLATKVKEDSIIREKWTEFTINSLKDFAGEITKEIHRVSPDTRMGLQHAQEDRLKECHNAILKEMFNISGHKVEFRPGGGYYYDRIPYDGILKSMLSARHMKIMGDPNFICNWCPEIEMAPRVYGSRSAQSILIEGFTALAYGLTSISYFLSDGELEPQELYAREYYRPLSDASTMINEYAKENIGTIPVGYEPTEFDVNKLYSFSVTAIPVLPGIGKSLGKISQNINIYDQSSSKIQEYRESLPAPATCTSPFVGIMIPRIDTITGSIRTIGLINTRIDQQQYIRIRLDGAKETETKATWFEMKKNPIILPIEREEDKLYVTIPEIEAWSAGFISIK